MAPVYLSTEIAISSGMIHTFSLRHSPIPKPFIFERSWYYQRILSLCSALSAAKRNIFFPIRWLRIRAIPTQILCTAVALRRPTLLKSDLLPGWRPMRGDFH